eukprot:13491-Heterococcus_DN1.PRE.1
MLGAATTTVVDVRAGQQLMVPVFFTQAHKIINELLQFCERSGTLASTGGPLAPSNDSDLSASSARAMFESLMAAGGNSVVFAVSLQNLSTILYGNCTLVRTSTWSREVRCVATHSLGSIIDRRLIECAGVC